MGIRRSRSGQLERPGFDRQADAVPVRLTRFVRYVVLRIGNQQLRLLGRYDRLSTQRCAARVGGGRSPGRVAEFIHLESEFVGDARIMGIPLVVVGERLGLIRVKDRVSLAQPRLKLAQLVRIFGHRIRVAGLGRPVVGIHLLTQRTPFESAAGFPRLISRELRRQIHVRQRNGCGVAFVVLVLVMSQHAVERETHAGVEPAPGANGRRDGTPRPLSPDSR